MQTLKEIDYTCMKQGTALITRVFPFVSTGLRMGCFHSFILVWLVLISTNLQEVTSIMQPPRSPFNYFSICAKIPSYLRRRTQICHTSHRILGLVILNGTALGTRECQRQFNMRRWNCTTQSRSVEKIVSYGYRETAFLFAIQAAGVAHAIASACVIGILEDCRCTSKKKRRLKKMATHQTVEWSDKCLDDAVSYGIALSRKLMEDNRVRDVRGLIDEHNKEAGRMAIKSINIGPRSECRCHGISGACAVKQCWRRLPHFSDVGKYLRMKYDSAVKVMADNEGKKLLPVLPTYKQHTNHELVYSDDSPNFCRRDLRKGSLGTRGRYCVPGERNLNSCDILCCNRGHETLVQEAKVHCKCLFHFCCDVKCESCQLNRTIHRCL